MANGSGKKQVVIPKKFVDANGMLKDAAADSTIDDWILEQTQKDKTLHTTKLPIQAYETGEGTWKVNWVIKEVGDEDPKGKWFRGSGIKGDDTAWTLAMKDAIAQVGGANALNHVKVYSGTGDRAGYVSWAYQGESVDADQSWDLRELDDGRIIMWDRESGEKKPMIEAPTTTIPQQGATPILGPDEKPSTIQNPDGSVTKFYSVTNARGQTSIEAVKEWPRIDETADISLTGGGRLIPLGQGRYTYEPDPAAEFTFDAAEGAGDIITIPGGQLIRTSKNQYQFVRDTMEAGVKIDPGTDREFLQQPDGSWSELERQYEPDVIERGGREFLQQPTGTLAELAPRYEPQVTRVDGMNLFQQRSGAVSQLTPPNIDDVITQALIAGDYEKAFAFQDFRDRPTANEAVQTALQFARSPADQVLISSIARGETAIQPPPPGQIQRVGPQPDFLVQAYQDFKRRTQAGRAPTPEEVATSGAVPQETDLLFRLRDADRRDRESEASINRANRESESKVALNDLKIERGIAANKRDEQEWYEKRALFPNSETTGSSTEGYKFQPNDPQISNWLDFAKSQGWLTPLSDGLSAPITEENVLSIANDRRYETNTEKIGALWDIVAASVKQQNETLTGMGLPGLGWDEDATGAELLKSIYRLEPTEVPKTPEVSKTPEVPKQTASSIDPLSLALGYQVTPKRSPKAYWQTGEQGPSSIETLSAATPSRAITPDVIEREVIPEFSGQRLFRTQRDTDREALLNPTGMTPGGIVSDTAPVLGASSPQTSVSKLRARQKQGNLDLLSGFGLQGMAGGGTVGNKELTVVGEDGPEIAMFPTGTHILPLGKATKQDIRAAQATGRAYQTGGIVFGELPLGLRQLQAGRPITPSRGYLSRAAGLTLPSAQALQNLTPESLEVYGDLAARAGIPAGAFGQELRTTLPMGRRLPTSTMLPISRRGVR